MKYVAIENAEPGMVLANTVYDNNELVLIRANNKLTAHAIERITALGYTGVYVYDNSDISSNPPIVSEEHRIRAVRSLKKLSVDDCLYVANDIMEDIASLPTVIMETMQLSTKDGYTFTHSVNVCASAVVIGIGMGMNNEELKALAQGALLHDIGKMAVDPDILNKPARLTDEEYQEMKKHVIYGYNMLKGNNAVSARSKAGLYQHHENEDGTGYPQGLVGDQIHIFGKIIHVADVYDALTAKRCYKEAMNPADALEYLMAHAGTQFDREVVQVFLRYVAPYPVGATVDLSNGHSAVVFKNNSEFLSRPVVKQDDGTVLNLLETNDVTITGIRV